MGCQLLKPHDAQTLLRLGLSMTHIHSSVNLSPMRALLNFYCFVCRVLLSASSERPPTFCMLWFQRELRVLTSLFLSQRQGCGESHTLYTVFHDGSKRQGKLKQLKAFSRSLQIEPGLEGEPFVLFWGCLKQPCNCTTFPWGRLVWKSNARLQR